MSLKKAYSTPATTLRRYWALYGGAKAVLVSPYFHLGCALAMPCAIANPGAWSGHAVSILPGILGFSLGGYAILLALGAATYFDRVRKSEGEKPSVFEGIATSFLHFIIVQMLTLLMALLSNGAAGLLDRLCVPRGDLLLSVFGFAGWVLLFYSLTCALALSFRLFRLVLIIARL